MPWIKLWTVTEFFLQPRPLPRQPSPQTRPQINTQTSQQILLLSGQPLKQTHPAKQPNLPQLQHPPLCLLDSLSHKLPQNVLKVAWSCWTLRKLFKSCSLSTAHNVSYCSIPLEFSFWVLNFLVIVAFSGLLKFAPSCLASLRGSFSFEEELEISFSELSEHCKYYLWH